MARIVDLAEVQALLERDAQLVEVLPAEEYEALHLPGAVNLPLKELDAETAQRLDRDRPVVVYCWDALCDMSPRAATRLGELGFDAYDYQLSKVDWMAHGLPVEGTAAAEPTGGSFIRDDVVTCSLDAQAGQIRSDIDASPYGFALVLADRVVLGRVRRSDLDDAEDDAPAELLMEPGPSTTRPHRSLEELERSFERNHTHTMILTTPEGELLGVVRREDVPSR